MNWFASWEVGVSLVVGRGREGDGWGEQIPDLQHLAAG